MGVTAQPIGFAYYFITEAAMKEFHVKRSGIKRYGYILLCIVMAAASSLLIIFQESVLVGAIGMLFFGLGAVVIVWKTFGSPLLTLTTEGFTDNSTASSTGFIRWEMVSNMVIADVMEQMFISVCLKDTVSYLDTLSSLKRKAAEANLALGYGPINIALLGTSMRPEDVLSRMLEFWSDSHKGTGAPSSFTPPAIDNAAQNG